MYMCLILCHFLVCYINYMIFMPGALCPNTRHHAVIHIYRCLRQHALVNPGIDIT